MFPSVRACSGCIPALPGRNGPLLSCFIRDLTVLAAINVVLAPIYVVFYGGFARYPPVTTSRVFRCPPWCRSVDVPVLRVAAQFVISGTRVASFCAFGSPVWAGHDPYGLGEIGLKLTLGSVISSREWL